MRVVHVITRLIVGGAQENTLASVLGLRRKAGLDVALIAGPTTGPEGSLESTVASELGLLTRLPSLVRPIHPWLDWRALRELEALFRDRRPDIVHTHSGKAGILGRLAARRAGVRTIVHTIHGPSFGAFQGPLANTVFRWAERRVGRITTHFVAVADAMAEQYLAAGIGQRSQYSRVLSGFDLRPYLDARPDLALRARLGLGPDDFVVGKVARLFKLKGHDDLFAVAPDLVRACPRFRFLLVGDGVWRERFARRARALGLAGHFVFAGLVPPSEVPRYVGIMDVLAHLSRREGLPRALPQALAAGKPVVAFDCDGAREVCLDGQTGFLLPAGDRAGLQDRLLRLARDAPLRGRLGLQGQTLVRENFSIESMVDQLHSLYVRLLEERDSSGAVQRSSRALLQRDRPAGVEPGMSRLAPPPL